MPGTLQKPAENYASAGASIIPFCIPKTAVLRILHTIQMQTTRSRSRVNFTVCIKASRVFSGCLYIENGPYKLYATWNAAWVASAILLPACFASPMT